MDLGAQAAAIGGIMLGTYGHWLAIIAIAFTAGFAVWGRMSWQHCVEVCLVICFIFASPWIVGLVGG